MSIWPASRSIALNAACTCTSSRWSQRIAVAKSSERPHSGAERPVMYTRAPESASSRATPRPTPFVPPVTTATLPSRFMAFHDRREGWGRIGKMESVRRASVVGRSRRRESTIAREDDRLCASPDTELVEHARHVVANGFLADRQPFRNLRIAQALGQQVEHLTLTRRQR